MPASNGEIQVQRKVVVHDVEGRRAYELVASDGVVTIRPIGVQFKAKRVHAGTLLLAIQSLAPNSGATTVLQEP
jgi:hypothetical protein